MFARALRSAASRPIATRVLAGSAAAGSLLAFTHEPAMASSQSELQTAFHRQEQKQTEKLHQYYNGFQGDQEKRGSTIAQPVVVPGSPVSASATEASASAINRASWEEVHSSALNSHPVCPANGGSWFEPELPPTDD